MTYWSEINDDVYQFKVTLKNYLVSSQLFNQGNVEQISYFANQAYLKKL